MDDTMTAVPMERPEVMALAPLAAQARDYDGQAKAISTQRAYRIAWTDFTGWCKMYGQPALPASPEPGRPPDSRTSFAQPARHGPNRDAGDPPREGGGARPEGAGSHPQTCPVRALRAWLAASGITTGPLFRGVNRLGQLQPDRLSARSVALVVKRYAKAAGLDPANYDGHSLRAGLATVAAAGATERSIMAQTGHRGTKMLRRYIREGSLFRENAAAVVGL